MAENAEIFDIIGQIYDATMEPDLWPDLLCDIADICQFENAALVVVDPDARFSSVLSPRTDPAIGLAYTSYWWQHDPTTEMASSAPVGQFTTLADTGRDKFLASMFHNEFWRQSGLGTERLAVNLLASGQAFSSIVLQPSTQRDFIDTESILAAGHLIPHLARAVAIDRRLHHLELQQIATAHSPPPDHAGLIVIDREGYCLHADDAGENLLSDGAILRVDQGVVRLKDATADAHLRAVLHDFAKSRCAQQSGRPLPIEGTTQTLEVLPCVVNSANPHGRKALAKLVFRDRQRRSVARAEAYQHLFGLTPAEAALAVEMLVGDGRGAAAARCGITINTARTHLARVFEKTGVTRQAELIRVLLECGP